MKALIILILIFLVARFGRGWYVNRGIKRPAMKTTQSRDRIELREMAPMITASVTVPGTKDQASGRGFQILAGYIFGGNTKKEGIAMTAPVISQKSDEKNTDSSEKIAMTAPVLTQEVAPTDETATSHVISFVMPAEYTLDTLPTANDDRIVFTQTEPTSYYVWTFPGYANDTRANKQLDLFKQALQKNGLSTTGQFSLAQYNDPWTPPMMRTNEWWVGVQK